MVAVLVGDEDEALVGVGTKAKHAGHETAAGGRIGEAQLRAAVAAGFKDEVGNAVGLVPAEPVRHVDVAAVRNGELARRGAGGVGRREARAVGAQALGLLELDVALGVGQLEEHELVGQLRRDDVVRSLVAAVDGDEAAVARARPGADGDRVDDLVAVVLAVDDGQRVTAEIGDHEVAAARVEEGLVGAVGFLAGAELAAGEGHVLEELQAVVGLDVPDIVGSGAVGGADDTGPLGVERERDDARGALGARARGRVAGSAVKGEEGQIGGVLVDRVHEVRVAVQKPARGGPLLVLLAGDGEGAAGEIGSDDLGRRADEQLVCRVLTRHDAGWGCCCHAKGHQGGK